MTAPPFPVPPQHLTRQIGNISPADYMSSFELVNQFVHAALEQVGQPISELRRVLDFGCGLGRLLCVMSQWNVPGMEVCGAEINGRCVDWCRANLPFARVVQNDIAPPLPFPADHFDLICALSVFTHLSLDLQFAWAWDLFRVLRPGGRLLFSTHGPEYFPAFMKAFATVPTAESLVSTHLGGDAVLLDLQFHSALDANTQGQRETAVAHTRAAVGIIFDAFVSDYVEPVSLCAGHALHLLRKPAQPGTIAFPGADAGMILLPPNQWSAPVAFPFRLEGHRLFRTFLRLNRDFAGAEHVNTVLQVKVTVWDEAGGVLACHQSQPVTRMYGRENYVPITCDVSRFSGDVTVAVALQLLGTESLGRLPLSLHYAHCG